MPAIVEKTKSERFVARVRTTDKELFQSAAQLEGRSMATFVIAHAREAAQRILSERQIFQLNEKETRRFVETLLAAPRKPTERMKKAAAAYRALVTES